MAAAALGLVLLRGFTTLHSLYPGTRSGWFGPPERAAAAEVKTCRRLGPVSIDGFGYWWKCAVTVRVEGGRVVDTVVDRSIVTLADAGRTVLAFFAFAVVVSLLRAVLGRRGYTALYDRLHWNRSAST